MLATSIMTGDLRYERTLPENFSSVFDEECGKGSRFHSGSIQFNPFNRHHESRLFLSSFPRVTLTVYISLSIHVILLNLTVHILRIRYYE